MNKSIFILNPRFCGIFSLFFIEFFLIISIIHFTSSQLPLLFFAFRCLSFAILLFILNSPQEPAFKICWLLLILSFPVVGGCIFCFIGGLGLSHEQKKAIFKMNASFRVYLSCYFQKNSDHLLPHFSDGEPQIFYLETQALCPAYTNSRVNYFSMGELVFPLMQQKLNTAKRYIFLEYFLIKKGLFWDTILELLKKKSQQGLDIRLIYDDAGCFFSLPKNYPAELKQFGIQAVAFHPLTPTLSTRLNNRDHRKLLIIDGQDAFTGGINLADEYINHSHKIGTWKDNAIHLEGSAVHTMIVMFLSMWAYCTGIEENISCFFPEKPLFFQETSVVLPYTDIPMGAEPVGQRAFLHLVSRAKKYIYLTSPYLILDTATETALCNAAKAGICVTIITPHIPDKKVVFMVTRAYYPLLIQSGVRIFEFTSGFIHGKTVIIDGVFATIGTINLDFRSLFLHFENAVWLWNAPCIQEMEKDFLETLSQSKPYLLEKKNLLQNLLQCILRIFSPLM